MDLDVSKVLDAVGDPTEKRRYISLLMALRVCLGEVVHGPGDSLGHVPASL
ncbi:hypothetical protein OG320_17240 [Microbispora sp. NBC_01189]|uniref:hypothetical protein n=1 Tax=Microbispora sp. NBC_01189 TaxID=2903583 RepID=UPI002E14C037|nr:hypothetical protein OG320_17240 [Microbispora sp. NBC_01189]